MNYTHVHHAFTSSAAFRSATLSQRGIWITILQYCTSQENDGIIKNFTRWKHNQIRKTLGLDPATLNTPSPLWRIEGNDLIIAGYPHDKQATLRAKRQTLTKNKKPKSTPIQKTLPLQPPPPNQDAIPLEQAAREIAEFKNILFRNLKQNP